ncbi:MAG TPA: ornithine carbamoyltransferase [Burkholderiales bacterium]|nr:ornithine carbamoyltransferase [Burkholderiales bacterium]
MPATRHFLELKDFSRAELDYLMARTRVLKSRQRSATLHQPLKGKTLAMIFEKNSTRTRVSFEAGMAQLGGAALFLSSRETQLGRGEPIEDVAEVISRMVDVVMIRTFEHDIAQRFASHSRVPVINGLTDRYHPCQVLADIFTFVEQRGPIRGKTVAWIGDPNNVCNTWLQATEIFDFHFHVASPPGYELEPALGAGREAGHLTRFSQPLEAVRGADVVTTDVWTSMGFEDEAEERKRQFAGFQVNRSMMRLAKPDALFMHCLPAHRGEEVESAVIDGPQSVVWEEAENRMHTQKALLEYLLLGKVEQ